jgi:hypothetical protein
VGAEDYLFFPIPNGQIEEVNESFLRTRMQISFRFLYDYRATFGRENCCSNNG